jgi:hypothetical protein
MTSTNDSDIHEWGMAFISRIDEIVNGRSEFLKARPDEDLEDWTEAWMEGDANTVLSSMTVMEYLTEEQIEWVTQFLSEI